MLLRTGSFYQRKRQPGILMPREGLISAHEAKDIARFIASLTTNGDMSVQELADTLRARPALAASVDRWASAPAGWVSAVDRDFRNAPLLPANDEDFRPTLSSGGRWNGGNVEVQYFANYNNTFQDGYPLESPAYISTPSGLLMHGHRLSDAEKAHASNRKWSGGMLCTYNKHTFYDAVICRVRSRFDMVTGIFGANWFGVGNVNEDWPQHPVNNSAGQPWTINARPWPPEFDIQETFIRPAAPNNFDVLNTNIHGRNWPSNGQTSWSIQYDGWQRNWEFQTVEFIFYPNGDGTFYYEIRSENAQGEMETLRLHPNYAYGSMSPPSGYPLYWMFNLATSNGLSWILGAPPELEEMRAEIAWVQLYKKAA